MQCRKVAYKTRNQARHESPDHHGRVYRCPFCGFWHRGHKPNRKDFAAARAHRRKTTYKPMVELASHLCGSRL